MTTENWVASLEAYGDPIERQAVTLGLLEKFPRYAEFWAKYVLPNRDDTDPSKLRRGFSPELEDICNNHYYVLYHFTFAYSQLRILSKSASSDVLLDFGDPLIHLSAAIDLIERTFVVAHRAKNEPPSIVEFQEAEYQQQVNEFWTKHYQKLFKKFDAQYRPVVLTLHSVENFFEKCFPKGDARDKFLTVSGPVREYRNLVHKLPPLRVIKAGVVYIPQPGDAFRKYSTNARWSSQEVDLAEYSPATDVVGKLAEDLVVSTNDLWPMLLTKMSEIVQLSAYDGTIIPAHTSTPESPTWRSKCKENIMGAALIMQSRNPIGHPLSHRASDRL